MIGQTISHYRVIEQIGAGGMGVVYRASDERLDRDVALKVLSPTLLDDHTFLSRFRQEARLLSKLNHPNIATLYEFDNIDGVSFLVMEFIKGETLDRKLASGPLAESEILRLGIQLLNGLQAAHEEGIIHRDLKPGNLRETPDGRLKILDFGLARVVQTDMESTQSAASTGVVGTLPYMAPEQLQGEPLDARTDLYAAGVVLYELATGQRPFTETLAPRLIEAILHRTATLPRELNPRVSPGLEVIIRTAMEKDSGRRYDSARKMCNELERLAGINTGAPPSQPSSQRSQAPPMEIAHVLFTDVVGYSKLPMDEQQRVLRRLQTLVRETAEYCVACTQDKLISLPTGDGMALVYFGEPESPVRCAVELSQALSKNTEIKLRMGINSGPVYRVADINTNRNVAGPGINMAQRVMDCGDAGHILVSKSVADVLVELTTWQGQLHDLGEVEVKHGVKVHVFNLVTEVAGNPVLPEKVKSRKPAQDKTIVLPRKQLWTALAALVALLVVAAGVGVWLFNKKGSQPPPKNFRPTVAVLGFKNQMATPQLEWVSTLLSDTIASELAAGDLLVPTPGESVSRMKTDMGLPNEASFAPDTIKKVHTFLNCDYVVYGGFVDPGGTKGAEVRLDLRLQNALTGELITALTDSGTELTLNSLAKRVGAALRAKLNLPGISMEQSDALQAKIPSTSPAMHFYYDGLDKLRNFDMLGARDSLTKAVKEDPNFSLAHAYLAEAWQGLGYDGKAREEAKTAFDLSTHLGREDKSFVEARYHRFFSEWDKALELYYSLWTLYPEKPEYAYQTAEVQILGGKANDAYKTIQLLRDQPGAISSDPRVDLKEAEAADALSDYAREKQAAMTAVKKAQEKGSRLLEAEALWRGCAAMANLGDASGANSACQKSIEIAKPVNDLLRVARGYTVLGQIATAHGDPKQGLEQYMRALEFARKIGSRRDIIGALMHIGNNQANQSDLADAQKSYEEALKIAREINDSGQSIDLINNLAILSQTLGNFPEALRLYQQGLEEARAIKDKGSVAREQNNMGGIYSLQGNFAPALQGIQQAVKAAEETGSKSDQALFLYNLGELRLAQGDLPAAEETIQAGLKLATEIGEKSVIAYGQSCLSDLRLQGGNASEAEKLARQAADEFHAESLKDSESMARNALAAALLALNRRDEAAKEMQLVAQLSPQDPGLKLGAAINSGRFQARSGNIAQAKRELEVAGAAAKKLGIPSVQFEAQLAEGELALFGGDKREGLKLLSMLEKDATKRGFKQFEVRAGQIEAQINAGKGA